VLSKIKKEKENQTHFKMEAHLAEEVLDVEVNDESKILI